MTDRDKSFDFEGDTVKQAIAKALKKLSVSKDSIVIKVVCEEKRGLFGMRGKPAKIKIFLKNGRKLSREMKNGAN